ncbi:DUF6538 domain-containing protein [uncultured Paracoccus sp.]|uniref:DUF6538 domain-containing protein n=1 Tax=uncultured Paracoccus sp. TaxID=189685 RepID=UPI00345AF144
MTHARRDRRRAPALRRPAGPYLQRRGRTFYFRKRLPLPLAKKCGRAFLCFSLRTPLLPEAMIRAARLLALLREEEAQLMARLTGDHLGAEAIDLTPAACSRESRKCWCRPFSGLPTVCLAIADRDHAGLPRRRNDRSWSISGGRGSGPSEIIALDAGARPARSAHIAGADGTRARSGGWPAPRPAA